MFHNHMPMHADHDQSEFSTVTVTVMGEWKVEVTCRSHRMYCGDRRTNRGYQAEGTFLWLQRDCGSLRRESSFLVLEMDDFWIAINIAAVSQRYGGNGKGTTLCSAVSG